MLRLKFLVVMGIVLVLSSCIKIPLPDNTPELVDLRLLGDATPQLDFSSTGEFDLNVIALDEENTVIRLSENQVQVVLDSVIPSGGSYRVQLVDVVYVQPSSAGKVKVALLLDSSGSMSGNDPNRIRVSASKEFIRLLLSNNRLHKAGIFDFAGGYGDANGDGINDYYLRVLQDFVYVSDTVSLFAAADSATESGGTPLYLSLWYLLDYLYNRRESGYGHSILVLTDGEDNESYPITSDSVIIKANSYGIPIYAVGLGDTSYIDFSELKRVANSTNGVFANAFEANALENIFNSMGFGISQGYSKVISKITPIPGSGSLIFGKIKVTSGGNTLTENWKFAAP